MLRSLLIAILRLFVARRETGPPVETESRESWELPCGCVLAIAEVDGKRVVAVQAWHFRHEVMV